MYNTQFDEIQSDRLTKLPNYLIRIEKYNDKGKKEELLPCTCITKALQICREENCICTIYETISTKGCYAKYLCDLSIGVI